MEVLVDVEEFSVLDADCGCGFFDVPLSQEVFVEVGLVSLGLVVP